MSAIEFEMPVKASLSMNSRVHWRVRHHQNKVIRHALGWLLAQKQVPLYPLQVTLVRIGPRMMDDDNLAAALKAVRDAVADWAHVDDGDRSRITFTYEQRKGPYGVAGRILGRDDAPGNTA